MANDRTTNGPTLKERHLTNYLHSRWESLYHRLNGYSRPGALSSNELFASIVAAYTQPHRQYHNLNHVKENLKRLDQFKGVLSDARTPFHPELVEWNIFWHDYVYLVGAQDNELLSAKVSDAVAWELGLPEEFCKSSYESILATQQLAPWQTRVLTSPHFRAGRSETWFDILLTRDVDYGALAKPWDEFAKDGELLRQEGISAVGYEEYVARQRGFLEGLRSLSAIYLTPNARRRIVKETGLTWEEQAQNNLERALRNLYFGL